MADTKKVKINRTRIVNGILYSKGGEYEVDRETAEAIKRAGITGKAAEAAPANVNASDANSTE